MTAYLSCLKGAAQRDASAPLNAATADHAACRELSKAYLACRMERGLMAPEDLDTLGFAADAAPMPAQSIDSGVSGPTEVIAGLGAARRAKMGVLFGLGSSAPAQRKSTTHD